MKTLKLIFDIVIGVIGGILGILVLGALWLLNVIFIAIEEITRRKK